MSIVGKQVEVTFGDGTQIQGNVTDVVHAGTHGHVLVLSEDNTITSVGLSGVERHARNLGKTIIKVIG